MESRSVADLPLVQVYTDGGARGNPGPAAIGVVVCDGADQILREVAERLDNATNNEAEYRALIRGLELAGEYTRETVVCVLDSELVVRQMTGRYRVREPRMAALHALAKERAGAFAKVTYDHRPRMTGLLGRADELVNQALDR